MFMFILWILLMLGCLATGIAASVLFVMAILAANWVVVVLMGLSALSMGVSVVTVATCPPQR